MVAGISRPFAVPPRISTANPITLRRSERRISLNPFFRFSPFVSRPRLSRGFPFSLPDPICALSKFYSFEPGFESISRSGILAFCVRYIHDIVFLIASPSSLSQFFRQTRKDQTLSGETAFRVLVRLRGGKDV